jgi:ATP-dependent protease HslVU (ClpYQ) peptidase subunit
MDGAMYMLSRQIKGDAGEVFMQNVAVFAGSTAQARTLVEEQFARLRKASPSAERAYQPTPAFNVEKIQLDRHKVITAGVTR